MPRQIGLGPLGHAAIERAATQLEEMERGSRTSLPVTETTEESGSVSGQLGNPAAISAAEFNVDQETAPEYWYPFDSSRVIEAGYSRQTSRLYVRFVKPRPEGTPWIYEAVSPTEWKNFRRSASPGRYVNRVLNAHDYHRGSFGS